MHVGVAGNWHVMKIQFVEALKSMKSTINERLPKRLYQAKTSTGKNSSVAA
jgi:hypothetical protein